MAENHKVLLIFTTREFGRGVQTGIAKYANLYGHWTIYKEPAFYRKPLGKYITETKDQLKKLKINGILGHIHDEKLIEHVRDSGFPAVIVPVKKRIPELPNILVDSEKIGQMAAEHLLERGLKNFAFCGFRGLHWSESNCQSFCGRIGEAGLKVNVYQQPKARSSYLLWSREKDIIADWLKSLPKPVGIMACNDDRAEDIVSVCKMTDLNIPDDIAVIGVDNDRVVCELSSPPTSSVALNTERGGYEAAELLEKLMSGEEKMSGQEIVIRATHIESRQSTDILAIDDYEMAAAIRFIRNNSSKPIQVSTVADAISISRRSLERRFRAATGHSVLAEIRRTRVENIAKLLTETNLSVAKIALELGFPGIDHIARYFQRQIGMSPNAYRKKYGQK